MKVTIGGATYKIAFTHSNFQILKRLTLCQIFRVREDPPGDAFVSAGQTRVHKNDVYCKETGRKLSLARALKAGGFSREERKLFWAAYRYRAVERNLGTRLASDPEPTSSPRRAESSSL